MRREAIVLSIAGVVIVLLIAGSQIPGATPKSRGPEIGRIMDIEPTTCGSTEQASNEVQDWIDRGDRTEATHRLVETGSNVIEEKQPVKVLDLGSFPYRTIKVRLLRTGGTCWVGRSALQ